MENTKQSLESKLYNKLLEKHLHLMKKGECTISEIYEDVLKYILSFVTIIIFVLTTKKSIQPEWKHVVRNAIKQLKKTLI